MLPGRKIWNVAKLIVQGRRRRLSSANAVADKGSTARKIASRQPDCRETNGGQTLIPKTVAFLENRRVRALVKRTLGPHRWYSAKPASGKTRTILDLMPKGEDRNLADRLQVGVSCDGLALFFFRGFIGVGEQSSIPLGVSDTLLSSSFGSRLCNRLPHQPQPYQ